MRLLHCKTLEFAEFFDTNVPKYGILSHRWEEDEVSYQGFLTHRKTESKGYLKVHEFCKIAVARGHEWVWIDTCCIDKTSSAELTEAINSMYRWYANAQICYAYLSDVYVSNSDNEGPSLEDNSERDFNSTWSTTFSKSAWFTRGWTLQELLAPKNVVFLDRDWNFIGTKLTLSQPIADRTGIDIGIFTGTRNIKYFSVAQKMSWASKRVTSRVEDIAYCLLGIFDINMPLLYGEGQKAFLRLQEEIIRVTDDESIFAWFADYENTEGEVEVQGAVLASSPAQFSKSGAVEVHENQNDNNNNTMIIPPRRPYFITNRGLRMDVPLTAVPGQSGGTFLMPLNCTRDSETSPLALLIYKPDLRDDRYIRIGCVTSNMGSPGSDNSKHDDRGVADDNDGGNDNGNGGKGGGGSAKNSQQRNNHKRLKREGSSGILETSRIYLHLRPAV